MNNFELRWLERKTGKQLMNEWGYYYEETVQVLQVRHKYDTTIYAGVGPNGDFRRELVWGEWGDVPVVEENEKH